MAKKRKQEQSRYYEIRREGIPITLGWHGMQFIRPGDIVLYLSLKDESYDGDYETSSCFVEARVIKELGEMRWKIKLLVPYIEKAEVNQRGYKLEDWSDGDRDMHATRRRPLHEPSGVERIVTEEELFWDPTRPIPSDRLKDFIDLIEEERERNLP